MYDSATVQIVQRCHTESQWHQRIQVSELNPSTSTFNLTAANSEECIDAGGTDQGSQKEVCKAGENEK